MESKRGKLDYKSESRGANLYKNDMEKYFNDITLEKAASSPNNLTSTGIRPPKSGGILYKKFNSSDSLENLRSRCLQNPSMSG